MSTAVATGLFTLGGVVVGGLLQGSTSWWMERRRDDWAARKAARLTARIFARCRFVLKAARDSEHMSWRAVALEIEESLARWPEYADVLAGTIGQDDWNEIAQAISGLERLHMRGRNADPQDLIDPEDRKFLGYLYEMMWPAAFASSLIGVAGIRRRVRNPIKLLWRRIHPPDYEQQAREIVRYSYEVEGEEPPEEEGRTPEAEPPEI